MIDKGIIVSIQNYNKTTTQELAKRAIEGGAVAIRTDQSIKVKVPVIGLRKIPGYEYYITSEQWAIQQVQPWADYIAIDSRKGNKNIEMLYAFCHVNNIDIVADIENIDDVRNLGMILNSSKIALPKYIATTFHAIDGKCKPYIISWIRDYIDIPVIAEGQYNNDYNIKQAKKNGASNICVGEAISKIDCLTKKFVEAWNE